MVVLALDTSTQAASAAVAVDGALLCEYTLIHRKTHSQKMLPVIDRILSDLDMSVEEVDVFAVGTGPGSFTGLRIGVAMAKGFAHTLGKKIIGVSTLAMLAENVPFFPGLVVPMMFARANECFVSVFRDGTCVRQDCVMTDQELADAVRQEAGPVLFVGDGAARWKEMLVEAIGGRAFFAPMQSNFHRSAALAAIALRRAEEEKFDDCMTLAPAYLRKSQAEREFG